MGPLDGHMIQAEQSINSNMNWVECDHRSYYSIPSWWNCKVQNNRGLDESSEIPPVEEMDEEEISESTKDSGRDTTAGTMKWSLTW